MATLPHGRLTARWALAAFFCALAAATLGFSAVLMVTGYVACPFVDQWWIVSDYAGGQCPFSLAYLWSQHNEHRIVIPRLLEAADIFWFGANNRSLLTEIALVQLAHWLLFAVAITEASPLSRPLRLSLVCLFACCLFSPNQLENFTWGFQISFVLMYACGSFALAAAIFQPFGRACSLWWAALAVWLATLNLAAGLVLWPFLLAVARAERWPQRTAVWLPSVAGISIAAYFVHYRPVAGLGSPLESFAHPGALVKYVCSYFGASWWWLAPHWIRALTAVALIVFFVSAARAVSRFSFLTPLERFLWCESGFLFATALATAVGRFALGPGQAASGRYQTPAMLFWGCLFSLLLLAAGREQRRNWAILAQAGIATILLATFARAPDTYRANRLRAAELNQACAAFYRGQFDSGWLNPLHVWPATARRDRPFLLRFYRH